MKILIKKHKSSFNLDSFLESTINTLSAKYKKTKAFWKMLSILVALINILIFAVCIYVFFILINTYFKNSENKTLLSSIGPQLFIVSTTFLLFPLTFISIIYSSKMKASKYRDAFEKIQYITIKYIYNIDQYHTKNKEDIYKDEIEEIVSSISKKGSINISYKKIIQDILIGKSK